MATTLPSLRDLGKALPERNGGDHDVQGATLAEPSEWMVDMFGGAKSASGILVNRRVALSVATAFACIALISRSFAALPIKLIEEIGDRETKVAKKHPVGRLYRLGFNEKTDKVSFLKGLVACTVLHGNGFAEIEWDGQGRIVALEFRHPEFVTVRMGRSGKLVYDVDAIYASDGAMIRPARTFLSHEMFHLKDVTFDGMVGVDTLGCASEVIALAAALDRSAARFFGNGARTGLVITHPSKMKTEVQEFLREQIAQKYTGVENAYKTLILQDGMKADTISVDNTGSQMDESRDRQAKEVCAFFSVPPSMVGLTDSLPKANMEEQRKGFDTTTLTPIASAFESQANFKLLTYEERDRYHTKVCMEALLRGNTKDQGEFLSKMLQFQVFVPNEVRALLDYNPRDGGDKPFTQQKPIKPEGDKDAA